MIVKKNLAQIAGILFLVENNLLGGGTEDGQIKASVSDLQKQFSDWPIKGLDKVIVIDQSGKPIQIK